MKCAALPRIVLLLALAPAGRAAEVTNVSTFPADKGPGYRKPAPDAAGAVGTGRAVALDDRAFVAMGAPFVDGITPFPISPADPQTTPAVTSSVVTVSKRKYTVYDHVDPATKRFCVVIPEGLKTVRGLLVECNYAGGDSRFDWTSCTYYREFLHLHDFALVASAGDIPHVKAFQAFRNCLQKVGVDSKHPELV